MFRGPPNVEQMTASR